MIKLVKGDILKADVEALVNTVNCVGYMGRGIALQFKKAFPDNFTAYKKFCDKRKLKPGSMFIFELEGSGNPRYIINFPTKRHWRGNSRMDDIESGLLALSKDVKRLNIKSIAIPPLGSGLGGLNWEDVRAKIERTFRPFEGVMVFVHEPFDAPKLLNITRSKKVPNMTPGRAVLIGLIRQYLAGLMDTSITLIELHKLMYFTQAAGEDLRLRYTKASHGPYAENLRHVLSAIDGYFISGYDDGGDNPKKEITLVPGGYDDAALFLNEHPETRNRFDRVAELVEGFETPFGMELLATVHWIGHHEKLTEPDKVVESVYRWSPTKKKFERRQIVLALDILKRKGWLPEEFSVFGNRCGN